MVRTLCCGWERAAEWWLWCRCLEATLCFLYLTHMHFMVTHVKKYIRSGHHICPPLLRLRIKRPTLGPEAHPHSLWKEGWAESTQRVLGLAHPKLSVAEAPWATPATLRGRAVSCPPGGWRGWNGCTLPVPSVTGALSRAWASWAPRKDEYDVESKANRLLRATEPWCDLLQRWQLPDWPEVCPSARSSQGAAS